MRDHRRTWASLFVLALATACAPASAALPGSAPRDVAGRDGATPNKATVRPQHIEGTFDAATVGKVNPPPARVKGKKVVYLTYDDGPDGRSTPAVLRQLKRANAVATFFVIGYNVRRYPEQLRHVIAAGGTLGNHTLSHRALTSLNDHELRAQLAVNQRLIRRATGFKPTCFRPPYGATNSRVQRTAAELGLKQRMWNNDWTRGSATRSKRVPARSAAREVIRQAHPGSIILMHDAPTTQGLKAARITKLVLASLKKKGWGTALLCPAPAH